MSKQYLSFPKVNLSFPTANISYCVVSYKGNTTATSGNIISGNISTGKYTTGDLSFNTLYTFTLTPYSSLGLAGISKKVSVDTTPQISGTKSSVKSTYDAATLQWSGTTYDNYTVSRSTNSSSSYSDISTNIKTNYYYDNDLSGNTVYYYYVKPYDATGNPYPNATTISIYTNVRAPTDLSYTFLDSSGVSLKWTTKNSYNTSYYNAAYVVNQSGNIVTSVSGDIQNATITGLTRNTNYTCYAQTYLVAVSDTVSVSTATPYVGGNILLYNVSMNSISVSWSGQYYNRVAVSRRVGTLQSYTTVSGDDYASPYVDSDISGNTTYYYYVTPKISVFEGPSSSVVSATTPVAYPTDVTAVFYDSSAIRLSFSTPKNAYNTSVVYSAIASNSTNGNTTAIGTSPIMIKNLSMGTTYTCYIKVTLDDVYSGISNGLSVTTDVYNPLYFSSISVNNMSDFTTTTSNYYIYAFKATSTTYTFTYTATVDGYMYALTVAGGGAGGTDQGGAGGGGGVCKTVIPISSGTDTITFSVGAGSTSATSNGGNSTISFTTNTSRNVTAYGGGYGGTYSGIAPASGGSGGSGVPANNVNSAGASQSAAATAAKNYGNSGGSSTETPISTYRSGGGGGAGSAGQDYSSYTTYNSINYYGSGGDGIQATDLVGIKDSSYGTYYWGGGGGGRFANGSSSGFNGYYAGKGGKGGGGGGSSYSSGNYTNPGIGDSVYGISAGGNGLTSKGGNGGTNTGGGGGASSTTGYGYGGSGIVVIAIPSSCFSSAVILPVAQWTYQSDAISGSTVKNLITGTYDLTMTNGAAVSTSVYYKGTQSMMIDLDTINSNGYLAYSGSLSFSSSSTSFTFCTWCYQTNTSNRYGGQGFMQTISDTITLRTSIFNVYGYTGGTIPLSGTLNVWQHIAITVQTYGTTALMCGYRNGQLIWSSGTTSISSSSGKALRAIGTVIGGSSFYGYFYDTRIYDFALNNIQVNYIYSGKW